MPREGKETPGNRTRLGMVMQQNDEGMPTEPFDSPCRWIIPSRSESGVSYLVDLSGFDGVGSCQCRDFDCRCVPSIKLGKPKRCRHILIARELFTDWIIPRLAKLDTNKE